MMKPSLRLAGRHRCRMTQMMDDVHLTEDYGAKAKKQ
jgi:hypothetical protein